MREALVTAERIRHFVEHDPHGIATARPQPRAEEHIGRFPAERVRNVLHEKTPRSRTTIERASERPQRCQSKMIREPLNADTVFNPRSAIPNPQWRGPYVDGVAGADQFFRDEMRVVAHAARLRRIFAGDDVPVGHRRASSIGATRPILLTALTSSIDASSGLGISPKRTSTPVTRGSSGNDA